MERELGPQVAGPLFIHQAVPTRFCEPAAMAKKRDLPWANTVCHQSTPLPLNVVDYRGPSANWNPKAWGWDSLMCVAKPVANEQQSAVSEVEFPDKGRGKESLKPPDLKNNTEDDDAEGLTLKLGGGSYSMVDDAAVRPNKRVRSGSPNGSYPMCQVDDCKADLSNAKDYHRRHKVCEVHSKTTKALVGKQMQRFCQQCSRFHPLLEFDEGKRSCRRRLAGHNRRRRKTQPEDASSRLLLSGGKENATAGNLDLVNLLTVLARLQGSNADKSNNGLPLPDKDNHLLQILGKINSMPLPENISGRFPLPGNMDLNVKQMPHSSEHLAKSSENQAAASSDFLAVISAALAASSAGTRLPSNVTKNQCDEEKGQKEQHSMNASFKDQVDGSRIQSNTGTLHPSCEFESSKSFLSPDVSKHPVRPSRPSIPLQLFMSSPEEDSSSRMDSGRKYFSSDSSNPTEERSPSSSPVVQKLFPLHSAEEMKKTERVSSLMDNCSVVETAHGNKWGFPLNLLKGANGRTENGVLPGLPQRFQESASPVRRAGYTSSSGSDHSPSSSNSDARDRTGRIIFKLFDKDPSDFPPALRLQILDWLDHSPSDMESYIRPGCVVLAVYVSMPCLAWEKLREDFRKRVTSLVHNTASEFWRSGRFLVHMDGELASHMHGKIRISKSWKERQAPELIYASPLAVVGGQETAINLIGRNLRFTGTRIHCTYMGGYASEEVSENPSIALDELISSVSFSIPCGASMLWGRFFLEVENGFKGNSFPIIVADADICMELRSLEAELEQGLRKSTVISDDRVQDSGPSSSREDIVHFLNELGWLFQRRSYHKGSSGNDFSCERFKHLFVFSVERDWIALVKNLLDILMERNLEREEVMEILSEIHLLNRAVNRRCVKMVNLLLQYRGCSKNSSSSTDYLFTPNSVGVGGITPLHLAACARGSEDLIDALTNDPQEIGLKAWTSALDASGTSPHGYALLKSHHSYNSLVHRKLVDRASGQVSITVEPTEASTRMDESWIIASSEKPKQLPVQQKACTSCAIAASRRPGRLPAGRGLLYRPYINSVLAIAAVCVCVCILCRGRPQLGKVAPFMWENISYGWL
ncbi:squamosa promoter-binding-like protein 14 [Nymphaea colorata]|nr:squamosa promoter-binding-like protein 14 [Nymphaea colorata]XP_031484158.1 squamosa promoter-binding-like protein 14 [Nymphaea colorata]